MRTLLAIFATLLLVPSALTRAETQPRLNVLLITVDDMNYDTPGFAGGKVADITPNLDKLARESLFVRNAHVTVAVCQPSRSVLMTGRYPHRNGAEGFQPIRADVPTLGEVLHAAGYFNGIMAKVPHIAPVERMHWDVIVPAEELAVGRDPKLYYARSKDFFESAKREGKPFFLMANSQDPHRPWPGSAGEKRRKGAADDEGNAPPAAKPRRNAQRKQGKPGDFPPADRIYKPEEVIVPAFLPDLPEVRAEMAQYYSSAHRADEIVGSVLRALKETGFEDNTLVMFLSDNGISQPLAKSNCYLTSTRTPWLVRWPGHVKGGRVDETHFISGIDFMPTVLDALGLKPPAGMDGRSFLPLLAGEDQADRDGVVTVYHETSGKRRYEMRCAQDAHFGYIYNGWSDGKTVYQAEPLGGLAFQAMKKAAASDAAVAARVKMVQYRVPEELYDLNNDPAALHNLIDDPNYRAHRETLRAKLRDWMREKQDPQLAAFERRLSNHSK
jgi:N-sulfoglucosamine sulfohydrolase